jgi:hypothetical protein
VRTDASLQAVYKWNGFGRETLRWTARGSNGKWDQGALEIFRQTDRLCAQVTQCDAAVADMSCDFGSQKPEKRYSISIALLQGICYIDPRL